MEISCACVCFYYITFRCFFVGVLSCTCISVLWSDWHDVNAFQIGLQNNTPVIVVTQKMMHSQGIKWSVCQGWVVD